MDPGQRRQASVGAHSAPERVGEAVDVAQHAPRSKASSSCSAESVHLGVVLEHGRGSGALLGPGLSGVALDDAVRLVPGQSGGDEGQEHRLGEDEAERPHGEVLERSLGVDHEPSASPVALRRT